MGLKYILENYHLGLITLRKKAIYVTTNKYRTTNNRQGR